MSPVTAVTAVAAVTAVTVVTQNCMFWGACVSHSSSPAHHRARVTTLHHSVTAASLPPHRPRPRGTRPNALPRHHARDDAFLVGPDRHVAALLLLTSRRRPAAARAAVARDPQVASVARCVRMGGVLSWCGYIAVTSRLHCGYIEVTLRSHRGVLSWCTCSYLHPVCNRNSDRVPDVA